MELNDASIFPWKVRCSGHGNSWKMEDTQKGCVLVKPLTLEVWRCLNSPWFPMIKSRPEWVKNVQILYSLLGRHT